MNIDIVLLDKSSIPSTASLVAGYVNSSSDGRNETESSPEQLEQCEQTLHRLIDSDLAHCYIAKHGQQYVGFILLSWSFSISKGHPVLRIDALYTSSKHRKKGVGRKLMQYAMQLAVSKKASRLQLETDEENVPARRLYQELGFTLIQGKGVYMSFL
ncbi:GNAT family N-acetyltransferase [Paenibacillus silviterrae]|uniref:GNAT family N-acetyltransferase n=1 Tax=Paenibacillus silviterrae TaxID=3242194 RepID=UPI002542F1EF|nr:GNAT family N-acetyltransferase [Paenibacillus chinjuensis]